MNSMFLQFFFFFDRHSFYANIFDEALMARVNGRAGNFVKRLTSSIEFQANLVFYKNI